MSGRAVRLLPAAIAAAVSLLSISTASAGCYSCGCGAATYSAPVVYSYTYSAPVVYAQPCAYASPMYVVNQGPAYTAPVPYTAEPTAAYGYSYGYRRAYPYYSDGGVRWHRRHWHRGYGYRQHYRSERFSYRPQGYGYRPQGYGYRQHYRSERFGYRPQGYGYRHHGYRDGAVPPRHRYGMRHTMEGPGGIYRGPRHRTGVVPSRHWNGGAPPRHMGRPGSVHPMGAPVFSK